MFGRIKSLAVITIFMACAACTENEVYELASGLELFNPLYGVPKEMLDNGCVIEVDIVFLEEEKFLATLDRISKSTGNDIVYSNPSKRDKVAYFAPVKCDNVSRKNFSPAKFFDGILGVTKTKAKEHPFLFNIEDHDPQKKLVAELTNAAFAMELILPNVSDEEELDSQWNRLFCIKNAHLKAQTQYSLPLTYILLRDSSLLYIYNIYPEGPDLIYYLAEKSFDECGVEFDFEVRSLNAEELDELSSTFSRNP